MTSYQTLKDKPKRFLALTGYTPEEFSKLSSCFSECFLEYVQTHTLEGKRRKKRRCQRRFSLIFFDICPTTEYKDQNYY